MGYKRKATVAYNPYAKYARTGAMVFRGARNAYNLYSKYKRGQQKRVNSGQGVTTQFDRRTVYRYKRMPRRRRKRWVSFVKKVQSVNEKTLGKHVVLMNSKLISTGQTTGESKMCAVCLYGWDGTNAANETMGCRDLHEIITTTELAGETNGKVRFTNGILDVTLQAASDNANTLEVDVYEFRARVGKVNYADPHEAVSDVLGNMNDLAGRDLAISETIRGFSPFQAVGLGKTLKIVKKTKFLLSSGQCATYQIRDPKSYVFNRGSFAGTSYVTGDRFACRATKGLLIVHKLATGIIAGQSILHVGVTREYKMFINSECSNVEGFLNP